MSPGTPAPARAAQTFDREQARVTFSEWSTSMLPVEVDADGRSWSVVLPSDDGTRAALPSDLISDLYQALGVLEPPVCRRCDRYVDLTRDDELCAEHSLSRRHP